MSDPRPGGATRASLASALKVLANPPEPSLTNAERQARWRAAHGSRQLKVNLSIETAAAIMYLKKQWGLKSDHEAAVVAIRALAVQTRKGLKKIELTID